MEIAADHGPLQTVLLTVVSRNDDLNTLIAKDDDDVEYVDIRLRAVLTDTQSITIYPSIGSWILCARVESDHDWFVNWSEQIDKINIVVGNCILESDGTKWSIKNNEASLLDILTNIIAATQQIVVLYGNNPDYVKLQTASSLLNNLLQ